MGVNWFDNITHVQVSYFFIFFQYPGVLQKILQKYSCPFVKIIRFELLPPANEVAGR